MVKKMDGNDYQDIILEIWRDVLGDATIGPDDNFFDVGGTSVKALEMINMANQKGLHVPFEKVFTAQTVREIALMVEEEGDRDQRMAKDLLERFAGYRYSEDYEKALEEYRKRGKKNRHINRRESYQNIFITGGNGFLASHLVNDIVKNTNSKITLILREAGGSSAEERMEKTYTHYFGQDYPDRMKERIRIIQGDITADFFGLSQDEFETLSREVDCVIHAAGMIKHFGLWEDFYRINVKPTETILRMAEINEDLDIMYISTVAVGYTLERSKTKMPFTEYDHVDEETVENFYIQSKLMSEKKVLEHGRNKRNVKVFRLGYLVQNRVSGKFPLGIHGGTIHHFSTEYEILSNLIDLGYFPEMDRRFLDFTYVDQAAEAIRKIMEIDDEWNIYHIINENKLSFPEFAQLLDATKISVETVSLREFSDLIMKDKANTAKIKSILNLALAEGETGQELIFNIENGRTKGVLEQLDFSWSKVDKDYIGHFIRLLEDKGESTPSVDN